MTPKEFQKYLDRDGAYCPHCGTTETLVPQHRAGRGMGGSKKQTPANIILLCSLFNGLIESDAVAQATAKRFGYKLSRWQTPEIEPYFDIMAGKWFILNTNFTKSELIQ